MYKILAFTPLLFMQIMTISCSDPAPRRPALPQADAAKGYIMTPRGWQKIEYTVAGDIALYDDDIYVPLKQIYSEKPNKTGFYAFGADNGGELWPNKTVPYEISEDFEYKDEVEGATAAWAEAGIKLVKRTDEENYVVFEYGASEGLCGSSAIGMRGGAQAIYISHDRASSCPSMQRTVIHELGHALGVYHEHQRPDRDNFIRILTENMRPNAARNFGKRPGIILSEYDFSSIMHYASKQSSENGSPVIVTLDGETLKHNFTLSESDISGMKELYSSGGAAALDPWKNMQCPKDPDEEISEFCERQQ